MRHHCGRGNRNRCGNSRLVVDYHGAIRGVGRTGGICKFRGIHIGAGISSVVGINRVNDISGIIVGIGSAVTADISGFWAVFLMAVVVPAVAGISHPQRPRIVGLHGGVPGGVPGIHRIAPVKREHRAPVFRALAAVCRGKYNRLPVHHLVLCIIPSGRIQRIRGDGVQQLLRRAPVIGIGVERRPECGCCACRQPGKICVAVRLALQHRHHRLRAEHRLAGRSERQHRGGRPPVRRLA